MSGARMLGHTRVRPLAQGTYRRLPHIGLTVMTERAEPHPRSGLQIEDCRNVLVESLSNFRQPEKEQCNTQGVGMRRLLCGLPACALAGFAVPVWADDSSTQYTLEIEQQPIVAALTEFSRQTGLQVGYLPETPEEENAIVAPLKGQYTVESALKEMLKPSGLGFERVNERTVSVGAVDDARARRNGRGRHDRVGDALSEAPRWRAASLSSGASSSMGSPSATEVVGPATATTNSQNLSRRRRLNELEEVVVTGSRIPLASEGAQPVRVYRREDIQRSGQTTVSGFLNGLPSVSVSLQESTFQNSFGTTSVRLRGLPIGTTLLLINGQRLETSGSMIFENVFDLNSIPVDAVERVEVLSSGTSMYGSDGIAGVVNIILKNNFDGLHVSARYGEASGISESNASVAWGHRGQRGSLSVIGTYQDRSELRGSERELTASNDYRKFGGPNRNRPNCHPGNVFFPNGFSFDGQPPVQFAAVPAGLAATSNIGDFASTAGMLNTCGLFSPGVSIIPATERVGVLVGGEYELAESASVFSDLIYSRTKQHLFSGSPAIGSPPGFQQWTVSPANPYNPFGTTVAVAYAFPISRTDDAETDFGRALLGARGKFGGGWAWELSSVHSQDWTENFQQNTVINAVNLRTALNSSDPAMALNPFTDDSPGSSELLQTIFGNAKVEFEGRRQAVNGFVRGPVLELPAGAVELAVGSEWAREKQYLNVVSDASALPRTDTRNTTALFGEVRVPVLSDRERRRDVFALTLAARYDDYSDFGSTTNPQFAAEWRPLDALLVRGTYADAFKAPALRSLNDPQNTFDILVRDPTTGQQAIVPVHSGGNLRLRPEVGRSETMGVVYSSKASPNFRLSITHWKVRQIDAIQNLSAQGIVDHEASFPGRVTRDQGGAIQAVDARIVNFGGIDVAGLDYDVNYQRETSLGKWLGSISATQTYSYDIQLAPGVTSVDRVSAADTTRNWAPRWKGTTTVGWERGPCLVNLTGRYVSRYQDYASTRKIGDFWLYDAHFRYEINEAFAPKRLLKGVHLEFGAVNVFDTLPQYSNYSATLGYDPAQADIRGRYLYFQVGAQL